MKSIKGLWLVAGVLVLLLGLVFWREAEQQAYDIRFGVNQNLAEFIIPGWPRLFWQPGSELGYDGENLNLEAIKLGYRRDLETGYYAHLQPGLWLLETQGERLFVFANQFDGLDPTLPVEFNSDWVVLQRSSLLPASWPEPRRGWVVLNNGTLSQNLKQLSLNSGKPVVRPSSGGPVWVQKKVGSQWEVVVPE